MRPLSDHLSPPDTPIGSEPPPRAHVCETCQDARWIVTRRWSPGEPQRVEPCPDCNGVPDTGALIAASGIPQIYDAAQLPPTKVGQALARWLELPAVDRPGLVLAGPPGTGKTSLACVLLRECIVGGHTGRFYDVGELVDDLRELALDGDAFPSRLIEGLVRLPFLVLDDLGAQRTTEFAAEYLVRILQGRLQAGRPTILTTNEETPAELNDRLGFRVADRAQGLAWIEVGGPSFRRREGLSATERLGMELPSWAR